MLERIAVYDAAKAREDVARAKAMLVGLLKGDFGGMVFHAGSTDWVVGLQRQDPFTMQITKNVIDNLTGRELPTKPARPGTAKL